MTGSVIPELIPALGGPVTVYAWSCQNCGTKGRSKFGGPRAEERAQARAELHRCGQPDVEVDPNSPLEQIKEA